MTDIELLKKLAEFKKEDITVDTILGYSDDGEAIRVGDVKTIDVSETDVEEITENICFLSCLEVLNIRKTHVSALPDSIGSLTNLQGLGVSDTSLTALPEAIGNLTNLQVLYVSDTQLITLPEAIGNLTNLQVLDVSGDRLTDLPDSIGKLTNLQNLYIRGTQLTSLPDSIGKLTNLQKLEFYRVPLIDLPDSIGKLTNLQRLEFYHVPLTDLPDSIGKLTNLQVLNVSETPLPTLPDSIGSLINLRNLEFRGTQLTTLPDSIGKLTSLQVLNISEAPLLTLPDSIGNLTNLQGLYIFDTQLTTLPDSIGKLTNLQELNVSGTQLAALPNTIGNLSNLKKLDTSNTQLAALPDTIGNLSNLQELHSSNTQLTVLPESIGKLTNLQELNVSGTQLIALPEAIGNLTNLQGLYVGYTQLTALSDAIGNLTNLQWLNVSNTQLTTLPDTIWNLRNLKELDVSYTQLTALPEAIGNLINLQELIVSGTQLAALPEAIWNLTNLGGLYVSNTQLTVLAESIGNLMNLRILSVSGTQLTALPKAIGNLTNLEGLYVGYTRLTALPEAIGNLKYLQWLNVSSTQLTTLPDTIGKLYNLRGLDISNSKICRLSDVLGNLSIKTLNLTNLNLDRLPKTLLNLNVDFKQKRKGQYELSDGFDNGIYISGLSLSKQPVSLFYQNRELIKKYYEEEMVLVNSAKIIFLGDGEVGKTYTLKRLLNGGKKAKDKDTYPTQTTHGVLIKPYYFTDSNGHYNIKLWDFGGQQIMHSMHRCFLTERSCYVVMISTRTDRDLLEQARYWLRTVSSFAPDSPVILLVNQWTKNLIGVDEYRLREEFANLKQFLYFSVVDAEDETFLTLKDAIAEQVRQLDGYGMEFPKSWHELMTDLENEKRFYIPKGTYYQKCFEKGLLYEDTAREGIYEWLLDWFNDLGVCFSYHKNSNSQILDNYELLNPQWLTRAAYVLINYGKQESDNGILTRKQIETILKETEPLDFDDLGSVSYEPEQIEYILEILRKFQISYQLPDGRELIPVLCDDNSSGSARPEWFVQNEMQHTSYEFQYEYLPDTIIHRLMIFCYQSHYHVRHRWRRGMSVDFGSDDTSRLIAVIDSGSDNQSITIEIYSDGRIPCWQFLSKLREEILQINADINLQAKDFINMETDGIRDRFSVEAVLKKRARGWEVIPADNYDGDYKISEILGSAYGPVNAAFIEKISVSQKGQIDKDSLDRILSRLNELFNAIGQISDRQKDMQIYQYLTKDWLDERFTEAIQNQEMMLALLNTLNSQPSKLKELGKKLLSGLAVTADIVTLVEAANPGTSLKVCEKVSEVIQVILRLQM